MRQVERGSTATRISRTTSATQSLRRGRLPTEVVLVIVIPTLCLVACGLYDPDLAHTVRCTPDIHSKESAVPVIDAVRMDQREALTAQINGQLKLWDVATATPLAAMQSQMHDLCCLAYAPAQRLLAVGSKTGQVEMWDLNHRGPAQHTADSSLGQIFDCQFTPDGKTLLTANDCGQIVVWDAATLTRRSTWTSPVPVVSMRSLAVSNDGQFVVAGTFAGLVQLWDLEHDRHLRDYHVAIPRPHDPLDSASIEAVAMLPGNREFIAASRNHGVSVWNIETGERVRSFDGDIKLIKHGVISPDGNRFTIGTMHGLVATWNTLTGQQTGPPQRHSTTVKALLYSADCKTLLTGNWNGQVTFHRLR